MKQIVYFLLFCFFLSYTHAGNKTNIIPFKNNNKYTQTALRGDITYLEFSTSINGPFTNTLSLYVDDSLFVKSDVSPLGTVIVLYFIDLNENGIIDSTDPMIGSDKYVDNNVSPANIVDLDPTPGVIVTYLNTGDVPSMTVIVRANEGVSMVEGTINFQNHPKPYTFNGVVYNTIGESIPGAMVWISDSLHSFGDITDVNGNFSIPIDLGTYMIYVNDFFLNRYLPFDTIMTFTDNTTHDFYLEKFTSYIRGYVRDETSSPIPNVYVWIENLNGAITDDNGMYMIWLPSGSYHIGVNSDDLLPNYMLPIEHQFTIGDNDSIVNNSVTNFLCYKTNDSITGMVRENGNTPVNLYKVIAWENTLQSSSMTNTNSLGYYSLPVYNSITNPMYSVFVPDWDEDFPIPAGMYPDTNYWGLSPGSVANFNILSADTSLVEHFYGNYTQPNSSYWEYYTYNMPWGENAIITCVNDRLKVECNSTDVLSGLGLRTRKPYSLNDIEFRVFVDQTEIGNGNNSVKIIFTDKKYYNTHPQLFNNSIQLISERSPAGYRRWRLVEFHNGNISELCTAYDSTSQHILFQFIDPDTLRLKIGGVTYYDGKWSNMLSMAYVYLTEFNTDPEEPTPVYFDEFVVGYLGVTGVREIGGNLPIAFALSQNYPNPFNPVTLIRYQVPSNSYISLKLFNTLGQEVKVLVNEEQKIGNYEVTLDASQLPSGVYYYRLTAQDQMTGKIISNLTQKAILLK